MRVIHVAAVDIFCHKCKKFIGQHVKECTLQEHDAVSATLIDYLNNEQWMPLCAVCTMIDSETISPTKPHMTPGDFEE